jgi:hypothetical protein
LIRRWWRSWLVRGLEVIWRRSLLTLVRVHRNRQVESAVKKWNHEPRIPAEMAPRVGVHRKEVGVIKSEAGNRIPSRRKAAVREHRIRRKIIGVNRTIPSGRTARSRRGAEPRAGPSSATRGPRANGRACRRGVRNSPGCCGNEGMRATHGRHCPTPALCLADEWKRAKKNEKQNCAPHDRYPNKALTALHCIRRSYPLQRYRFSRSALFPPRLGFPVTRDYAITEGP